MKKMIKLVAGAMTFGLLSGVVFQGTSYVAGLYGVSGQADRNAVAEQQPGNSGVIQTSSGGEQETSGVSAVAEAVLPSIVAIDVKVVSRQQDFFGRTFESQGEGSGSGILFKEDTDFVYIVTNNHVVADSVQVQITFHNETTANATVTGTDEASDLAVVKVAKKDLKDDTLSQIKIAELADSRETKVGEQAIAIGNALGYGTSVTVGYVSAKDRQLGMEGQDTMKLIQTDAAINPGNSGGALLNVRGEVVGINSSKIADYVIEGMGYAIPISTAKPIIEDLMQKETRKKVPEEERAFLGVAGTDVIEEATVRYEMPEGVFVSSVLEDTAAEEAGILKGDIIMYIDGEKIENMAEMQGLLEFYAAGTEVEVVLMRQSNGEYKERTVQVILGYKE